MKSEQVVIERARRKVQKLDLSPNLEADTRVFHLVTGQARLNQQRVQCNRCRLRFEVGEARYHTRSARQPTDVLGAEIIHGLSLLHRWVPDF
jgi:hypothetical protein